MSHKKSAPPSEAKRPLALLVDDDPIMREILRLTFEDAGWEVAEAPDARSALDGIRCLNPQLITLDLVMPLNEGFHSVDLVQTLNEEAPDALLIVISAYSGQPPVKTFFQNREVPVLSKTNLDKPWLKKMLVEIRQEFESPSAHQNTDSVRSNRSNN